MLQETAQNLWCAQGDLWMPGKVHFPVRMTVIRLSDGGLVLHSPIAMDDDLAAQIKALGPVRYLIAPNLWHHLFMKKAMARFPDAKVFGAPGLEVKRADIAFDAILGRDPAPWGDDLDQITIAGVPKMNETVFFHRSTGSLILTDLMFNIHKPRGWVAPLVLRLMGVYARPAQSRMWRLIVKDRDAAGSSVAQMLSLPIKRVVMAHGDILEAPSETLLSEVFTWMLRGQKRNKLARA